MFPAQGEWSEEEYLALDTNQFIEFSDGYLEFLPMPTIFHQLILKFLCWELDSYRHGQELGDSRPSPLQGPGSIEASIASRTSCSSKPSISQGSGSSTARRADLVMEVVSEENRAARHREETGEYARAGIPEYWIVDPEEETITVLVLKPRRKTYSEHGIFRKGTRAASKLLPGFSVDVTEALSRRP